MKMRALKPHTMAMIIATEEETTEANPLTAHATGMALAALSLRRERPQGNGEPMRKANGAIKARLIAVLNSPEDPAPNSNTDGRMKAYSMLKKATPAKMSPILSGSLFVKNGCARLPIPAKKRTPPITSPAAIAGSPRNLVNI